MKVVKVCHKNKNGDLVSLIVRGRPTMRIVYKPSVKVETKVEGSYIFSFENMRKALDFGGRERDAEFWEASAPRAIRAKWMVYSSAYIETVRRFWATKRKRIRGKCVVSAPRGTMFSKTITLKKRIASTNHLGHLVYDDPTKRDIS